MNQDNHAPVIALHGGCGVLPKDSLTEPEWAEARTDMRRALQAGWSLMDKGGPAVEAVEACVVVLEDSPYFNAGHGAALNTKGIHELDASIMDGATTRAGAICAARAVRNPVRAAAKLLPLEVPLMLAGEAADAFAASVGLPLEHQSYFTTPRRLAALDSVRRHTASGTYARATEAEKHGTVGAVARDRKGHLAAATSTGGYTNKPEGRVGDSAAIGAGTYARDGACAVSCTGQGEYFVRAVVGHEIASRIAYLHETLDEAIDNVFAEILEPSGIGAGIIAVAPSGLVVARYNTIGMFRGWIDASGEIVVAVHDD